MLDFYQRLERSEKLPKIKQKITFRDFAQWQRSNLQGGRRVSLEKFWLNYLQGFKPKIAFPLYKNTQTNELDKLSNKGDTQHFSLSIKQSEAISTYCIDKRISHATFFMGVYQL